MQRIALLAAAAFVVGACSTPVRQEWVNGYDGDGEDLFLVDDDLGCLADAPWESAGNFKVWNGLGHQLEAVEHARSKALGPYPVGTVLSLFHDEVSVKRGRGFSPETGDWEFIKLAVDENQKTIIAERGTTAISNVGGSCIACHDGANAFDFVCGTNDGCGALPFFVDTSPDSREEDPRCAE